MPYTIGFILSVLFSLMASIVHAHVPCGSVLTTDTILEGDVGPCDNNNSPALTVQGPASLDLNGFTVFCDSQALSAERAEGIYLIGKGAKVSDGTLKNCRSGVEIMGEGNHRVEGMVSRDIRTICYTVHEDSNKNTLTNNTSKGFTCNNGFEILGDKNTLTNNVASDHDDSGYSIHGDDNRIRDNLATNSGSGFSIDGTNNKVINNLAADTSGGFLLGNSGASQYNLLEENRSVANNIGFRVFTSANDNDLQNNISLGNSNFDMSDENDACDNNTWANNFFRTSQVNDGIGNQVCIE